MALRPVVLTDGIAVTGVRDPMAAPCFLPLGPSPDAPLPSTGSPQVRIPRLLRYYQGTATSCRPSRRTSLPSLGGTASVACLFAPAGGRRLAPTGQGVDHRYTPGPDSSGGNGRTSHVPREPQLCLCPVLRPRQAGFRSGHLRPAVIGPRSNHDEGSCGCNFRGSIAGL